MTATWSDPTAMWSDPDVSWDGTAKPEAPEAPPTDVSTVTCAECWALVLAENSQAHADWHRAPRKVTVMP
jgi:hypothetical protein